MNFFTLPEIYLKRKKNTIGISLMIFIDWFVRNENDNDHYLQVGTLYRKAMNDNDRRNLVNIIVSAISDIYGEKKDEVINRQLCRFFRVDIQLGILVANELGVRMTKDQWIMHRTL